MTEDTFEQVVTKHGWRYHRDWMPPGSYEDDDTGETVEHEGFWVHAIVRSEKIGDDLHMFTVETPDPTLSSPSAWPKLIEIAEAGWRDYTDRLATA